MSPVNFADGLHKSPCGLFMQGDRLQEVVQQLEAAIQPVEKPSQLKMLTKCEHNSVHDANYQQLQDLKLPMLPSSQQPGSQISTTE